MDTNDKEYYELLKQHLIRANEELIEFRRKIDLKQAEIEHLEEVLRVMEKSENNEEVS